MLEESVADPPGGDPGGALVLRNSATLSPTNERQSALETVQIEIDPTLALDAQPVNDALIDRNVSKISHKLLRGIAMPIFALADADLEVEDENAYWIAPTAVVIGKVTLKRNASVWFGAVVRGDTDPIVIGENSNVQDASVLHADHGAPLTIGRNVTIGHHAMVHGCTIGDSALIGIKATVLNHARIGNYCLVGAHALVTERKSFEDGSLITGVPARAARQLEEAQRQFLDISAAGYVENWKRFKRDLKPSRFA
ncbi:MAG: gamma carbonic anhydrase family protein [Hyphomonadaceae bacterium]|nr:gamma carbonic anhydrase family protein [Hyphomonadaceae bacterium]